MAILLKQIGETMMQVLAGKACLAYTGRGEYPLPGMPNCSGCGARWEGHLYQAARLPPGGARTAAFAAAKDALPDLEDAAPVTVRWLPS